MKDPGNCWCTLCGFRCTKHITEKNGRLLEDGSQHLYLVDVSIKDCRTRKLIEEGIEKEVLINKGERLI